MLYPQKLTSKKNNFILYLMLGISILAAGIMTMINQLTTPQIHWAAIANAGIVYTWITVMYAIYKNPNIAAHVLIQGIAISCLAIYLDKQIGFTGWSIQMAIPIIIIVANITMLILTIASHKKYIKYGIYQLMICLSSLLPLYWIYNHTIASTTLSYVASGISIANFILTMLLCTKDVKEVIVRKFHI